jgi:sulfofructosephosphate aldolase
VTVVPFGLDRLALPSGAFAMVALDQRESLRTMFEEAGATPAGDDLLAAFKDEAARTLAPSASAILLDQAFGAAAISRAGEWPTSCALIVAADKLEQTPGEPPTDSTLDESVDAAMARERGAVALKLLLYWRGAENAELCEQVASRFLERCRAAGLLGIVEGVVRPPAGDGRWDREQAVLDAARSLGACRPDIYKAEVPLYGKATAAEIAARAEKISDALGCPWVVLSNGVPRDRFEAAVTASCQGGASGFLAGRAIWADTLGEGEYAGRLAATALPRLERLGAIVSDHARTWRDVNAS